MINMYMQYLKSTKTKR
uniref:Uncharacterized protein n=1 Tax=Rhizophora mucronata TaxID=61149 RepID=A0A2P2KPC0_RHIMU